MTRSRKCDLVKCSKRVKSVLTTNLGSTTAFFVGNYYEVTGSTITKYYYAGTQQIAIPQGDKMRKNGTLNFIIGDHLGSTSLITDSTGAVINETKYKAWGETRYESGTKQTNYGYTGQYSYASDFGLMYYGARFYDPDLGRFTQPDTVLPIQQGVQAFDRYAYANNSPLRYTDPTGHWIETALDIAFIAYDIYDISQNGLTWTSGLSLAADVAGAVLPFVTGGGAAVRAIAHTDDVVDTVKAVDKAIEASAATEKLGDMAKIVGELCSFSAETKVTTDKGEKEISEIETGDSVLAWDEETNQTGYYEVTDTFSHLDKVMTELVVGGEWIEATPEHPFYTLEEGWLPADELESGMHIRQADGDYELVWFKWNIQKDQEMYNLTVDTAHTYFVGNGQWLVHNSCGDKILAEAKRMGTPDKWNINVNKFRTYAKVI